MSKAYGQRPSTWVLLPMQLATPEGQAFAYDFDSAVLAMGATFDAEQAKYAEIEAEIKQKQK
jgi:hypothetical protein